MTPFAELELAPLVAAAFDAHGTQQYESTCAAIEAWWRDRPFKPWDSRSAAEARALRTAARVDALVRLLKDTA